MKVIYGIGQVKENFKNSIVAIGVFDGLHLGHQKLIKKTRERAKQLHTKSVVLTFDPHPVHVLYPEIYLPLIIPLKLRLKLIEDLHIDAAIVVEFTKNFSRLSPRTFIEDYLIKYVHPKEILVGDDFRFGKDRSGTLDYFKEAGTKFDFKVNILKSVRGGNKKIGSTGIREYIARGQLYKARKLLGRNVLVMGTVIRGDARGRLLGFPTANIDPGKEVLPPLGVYAVKVHHNRKLYNGMANIGHRPSFKTDKEIKIEVHIFGFKQDIYGDEIIIEFLKKIRNEKVFHSQDQLIKQLHQDQRSVKTLLSVS